MINNYEATNSSTSEAFRPAPSSKAMSNDDVISTLNGLIQTCVDGEEGFRTAAEAVEASDTKTFFYENSQERVRFAGALQELVRSLGGNPEHTGTFTGAIHRGWMDLKAAIAGNDQRDVLSECERGEDSAKKEYRNALDEPLPTNVKSIVQTQCDSILRTHDRVRGLRDQSVHTASNTTDTGF